MNNTNFWPISLQNGLLAGALISAFSLVLYLLGFNTADPEDSKSIGWLSFAFTLAFYSWCIHRGISEYKNANKAVFAKAFDQEAAQKNNMQGEVSFGRCVGLGTAVGLVGGSVQWLYTFIFTTAIDPDMLVSVKKNMVREWEKAGMDDAQIEKAIEMSGFFMTPIGMGVSAMIMGVIFGGIIGLVAGMFMRTSN